MTAGIPIPRFKASTFRANQPEMAGRNSFRLAVLHFSFVKPTFFALFSLTALALSSHAQSVAPNPPIAVRFHLDKPGFVTLVIEDASGKRVRNLISETPLPAGENVVPWDGLDDLGRDTQAAKHAVYHVPGKLVEPGTYTVRGLVRPPLDAIYQFTPYTNGHPPWRTDDPSSQWLGNHTPPAAMLFVPAGQAPARDGQPTSRDGQILVGSYVSEGGSGLAWLDESGRKIYGQYWVGGIWTGVSHLARDAGPNPVAGVYAYGGAAWEDELRLSKLLTPDARVGAPRDSRLGSGNDRPLLAPVWKRPDGQKFVKNLGGLAVYNGLLVAALPDLNQLLFVDARAHKTLGTANLENPRGLAFDGQGRLLALSGAQLLRFTLGENPAQLPTPEIIARDLDEPRGLTLDGNGDIYVSQRGKSHNVAVFSPDGKRLRAIGKVGAPAVGAYDPAKMHAPDGLAIDSRNRLWVAESDQAPKRISVWNAKNGRFERAFYGPQQYGGGGWLDTLDDTRMFYADAGGGQEWKLDWKKGEAVPVAIYARSELQKLGFPGSGNDAPATPIHRGGRTYLTNSYNANPTNGSETAVLYVLRRGVAAAVAAIGDANDWKALHAQTPNPYDANLPAGASWKDKIIFRWSDRNDDGAPTPDEVELFKGETISSNFQDDLSVVTGSGLLFKPTGFSRDGAPLYGAPQTLVAGAQRPVSSGGGQGLADANGNFIFTNAPAPFSAYGPGGGKNGVASWSYPSMWPGLHAGHIAPLPEMPGELIATTRLLGPTVTPRGSDAGAMWAVNGNSGNVYFFTMDGLFVGTLFRDAREASWGTPTETRGASLAQTSLGGESFWPSLTQVNGGAIYLNGNGSILKVEGLEGVRRLPTQKLNLTSAQLSAARADFVAREAARQDDEKTGPLTVALRAQAPKIDGEMADWSDANWVAIDLRQRQVGDWNRRVALTVAALAVSGDRLFAAFKTDDPNLLTNAGESLPTLFKSGGALDLMIGAAHADDKRTSAVAGDARLLVTRVKNKTVAALYRPVAPDAKSVEFSSPLRTLAFDRVDDVSAQVELASSSIKDSDGKVTGGFYEMSVPLETLGLQPRNGQTIRGDIGILRGSGFQTLQRVYWHNKATGLVSDVPSEAELTPQLWGAWKFAAPAPRAGMPIIDTRFEQVVAGGALAVRAAPQSEADLPLAAPTQIEIADSDAEIPSQVRAGQELTGDSQKPFALINVGARADDRAKVADVVLGWELQKLDLKSGVYQINFDALARQTDKIGGRFALNLAADAALDSSHGADVPGTIFFGADGQLHAGGATRPYKADEIQHFAIKLDLDKRVWSLQLNGESWVGETAFPAWLPVGAGLSGVQFSSRAADGDVPDAVFGFANLKLTRLP